LDKRCILGKQTNKKNSQNIKLKAPKKAFFFLAKNKFTCLKRLFWFYLDKEIIMPMKALIFLAFANDLSRSLDTNSEHDLISQELKDIPQVQRLTVSKESLETVFRENSNSLQVFHFGGHGRKNALYLSEYQNNDLAGDFFVELLSKYPIKLAVLNACNSHEIAKKLSEKGISAIGTVGVIEDEKALRFAQSFYGHLAQGNTLQEAFERAKTASQAQQWEIFTQKPDFQPFQDKNMELAQTILQSLYAVWESGGGEILKNIAIESGKTLGVDAVKSLFQATMKKFEGKDEEETLDSLKTAVTEKNQEKVSQKSTKVLQLLKNAVENDADFKKEVENILNGLEDDDKKALDKQTAIINSKNVVADNTFGNITGGFRVGDDYGKP